jgi:hypothetical protein
MISTRSSECQAVIDCAFGCPLLPQQERRSEASIVTGQDPPTHEGGVAGHQGRGKDDDADDDDDDDTWGASPGGVKGRSRRPEPPVRPPPASDDRSPGGVGRPLPRGISGSPAVANLPAATHPRRSALDDDDDHNDDGWGSPVRRRGVGGGPEAFTNPPPPPPPPARKPLGGVDQPCARTLWDPPGSPPVARRQARDGDDDHDDDDNGWGSPAGGRGREGRGLSSPRGMLGPPGSPPAPRLSLTVIQPRLSRRPISCLKWCKCNIRDRLHPGEARLC